jgi:hypothetical protein
LIAIVANLKRKAANDWTPLHFAVDRAFLQGIEELIKALTSMMKRPENGQPYNIAADRSISATVKLLLAQNPPVDHNSDGTLT